MVGITFIKPLDQPTGRRRLLGELKDSIQEKRFSRFDMVVAYAKVGPLLRLKAAIDIGRSQGLKISAIFGVDQQGTSAQALMFALEHFDRVYVTREPNLTFHPKVYLFSGTKVARIFVGSNNLTVGGTETNFESSICLTLNLPDDAESEKVFRSGWDEMLPEHCPATKKLDRQLLTELIANGTVLDETVIRSSRAAATSGISAPRAARSGLSVKPPSALPARKTTTTRATPTPVTVPTTASKALIAGIDPFTAQGIAIQIKPHHNGEIFLSVTAALQNPAFFKWPFNGATVPKKGSNTAYPQLTPDPRVNAVVYGAKLEPLLVLPDYALNTVYYEKKSEIRITASPLVSLVPDYSIMIIQKSETPNIDYDLIIHTPQSPDYASWLAACNQQMPGGGQTPRRFGWF
jgi:hypothetical protein